MKPIILLTATLFLVILDLQNAECQNYQAVQLGQASYYRSDNSYWNYELEENIQAVMTDSAAARPSGDSVYYFYRIMRDTGDYNFGECTLDTMAPCWLGSHSLIKPDGDNLFFNRKGDSIVIKTQAGVGDYWVLLRQDDYYFRATVDSVLLNASSGTMDYVKVISLQAYNYTGSPFANWFNHKTFRLSKNSGFQVLYNLFEFPSDTNQYESYKYEPLTTRAVYDFEPGDVFHFKSGSILGGPPQFKVITILSKWMSTLTDTLFYRQREKTYINTLFWDPDPHVVSTTQTDTVTVSYANPTSLISDILPHQKTHNSVWDLKYYSLSAQNYKWNNRPTISFDNSSTHMFITEINCYTAAFEPTYDYLSYTKGCGASYSFHEEPAEQSGFYTKLVYYCKGNETWGDPFILNSVNAFSEKSISVVVYPNPFSDWVEIKIETHNPAKVSLTLYSIAGEKLLNIDDTYRQAGIYTYSPDISHLAKGIYIIRYAAGTAIGYKKLIRK